MRKTILFAAVVSLPFWAIAIALYFGGIKVQTTNITTQAPVPAEVRQYIKFEGWECRKDGSSTDLLQPSGLWVMQDLECWKLQTPIKEYCKTNVCHLN